jgi:hypothetical protein
MTSERQRVNNQALIAVPSYSLPFIAAVPR